MKRFHILLLIVSAMITPAICRTHDSNDSFIILVQVYARMYEISKDKQERKDILDKIYKLDYDFKKNTSIQMYMDLDEEKASGRDFRRVGMVLKATGQNKSAMACFYNGALKGEPNCINYVLVDYLLEKQDPTIVFELLSLLKGIPTLPLLHNMALALSQIEIDDAKEAAKTLGELYFNLQENPEFKFVNDNLHEYIDHSDNADLIFLNKSWRLPYDRKTVGKALRKALER